MYFPEPFNLPAVCGGLNRVCCVRTLQWRGIWPIKFWTHHSSGPRFPSSLSNSISRYSSPVNCTAIHTLVEGMSNLPNKRIAYSWKWNSVRYIRWIKSNKETPLPPAVFLELTLISLMPSETQPRIRTRRMNVPFIHDTCLAYLIHN